MGRTRNAHCEIVDKSVTQDVDLIPVSGIGDEGPLEYVDGETRCRNESECSRLGLLDRCPLALNGL